MITSLIRRTLLPLALLLASQPLLAEETEKVTHSFLAVGKAARTSIVGENGKVEWMIDLPASDGWVLSNGNVLLAVYPCKDYPKGGVAEIERASNKTVFSYQGQQKEISSVQPLANGNTLIGYTNGNRVIEMDPAGAITWKVDNEDLGKDLIKDACGIQRLPNGNTVIASYGAKGDAVKLTEVTRDKEVVWTYSGGKHGFHHFQVLTTNGQPLKDGTLR